MIHCVGGMTFYRTPKVCVRYKAVFLFTSETYSVADVGQWLLPLQPFSVNFRARGYAIVREQQQCNR